MAPWRDSATARSRSRPCSTTPKERPGPWTRSPSLTASWPRPGRARSPGGERGSNEPRRCRAAQPAEARLGPDHRLGTRGHRPGRRVRLRRHPGVPRPARGGCPDDPRELEPGHDHDRSDSRRRRLPRAAHRRGDRGGDRPQFRDLLDRLEQPYAPSAIVEGATDAERAASADRALTQIGLPAIIRPAFTLGGTGGGIVEMEADYRERVRAGLRASPIGKVMVEQCLVGWQEIEYEVMRDHEDTCIAVCSMENVDPLGVHTGDSIVVAPVQTLPDPVHQRLRSAALAIIRGLGVEGGCNVQFALSPDSRDFAVIE